MLIKYLVYGILCVLMVVGLFQFGIVITGQGISKSGKKTLKSLDKWNKKEKSMFNTFPFNEMMSVAKKFVRLGTNTREKLRLDLERANMSYTPEEYTATLYVSIGMGLLLSIFFILALKNYWLVALSAGFGYYLYRKQKDALYYALSEKDKAISKEMPGFILSIKSGLEGDRDVVHVIERYSIIAGDALHSELATLLMEIRAGDFDTAIMHFSNRLNNSHATNLSTILIQINKGIDQGTAMEYLAREMQTLENQRIEKVLSKRPGKMNKATIPVFIFGVAMMFVALGISIVQMAGELFAA